MSAVLFSIDDAQRAADEWGMNCGPAALAAIAGMTLDAVRPHLKGFDQKRYTNPTMMFEALRLLGIQWTRVKTVWPYNKGLVRVQ